MKRDIQNGQRFGRLVVSRRNGSDRNGSPLWFCTCDCGKAADIRAGNLRRGQIFCTKQCPLYQEKLRNDLTGKRFGKLVAAEYLRIHDVSGKAIWLFICDCGNSVERVSDNALTGNSQTCGCGEIASRIKHGKSKTLEYHREAHRRWSKENPAKVIANANKRRKDFEKRVPPWLTDEHWEQINSFYLEARRLTEETGIEHHVDHIYPLRGKLVSGLHVPWNLQVLTATDNLRKSARLIDDVC